jgi:hypothetical protein
MKEEKEEKKDSGFCGEDAKPKSKKEKEKKIILGLVNILIF